MAAISARTGQPEEALTASFSVHTDRFVCDKRDHGKRIVSRKTPKLLFL